MKFVVNFILNALKGIPSRGATGQGWPGRGPANAGRLAMDGRAWLQRVLRRRRS